MLDIFRMYTSMLDCRQKRRVHRLCPFNYRSTVRRKTCSGAAILEKGLIANGKKSVYLIFGDKFTLMKMWKRGLLFLLLLYSTSSYCYLIPKRSLVMATDKNHLHVFSGLENWRQNYVINNSKQVSFKPAPIKTRGISFILRENQELVIFSEAGLKTIMAINITSSAPNVIVLHIGTSSGVGNLAVDWVSSNCYWVDTVYGWIVMQAIPKDLSRLNALNPNFKMVIDSYLDIPTGIAVYPELGYLFWTDTGKIPKIERSSLTGINRKLLIWQGVIRPTSLCIDYSIDRLYWTDPARGTVEYSDLHGNERNILVSNPGSSFYGIDIFEDVVVVSELSSGNVNSSIKMFSKADGKQANERQVGPPITIPEIAVFSLSVFDERRQPLDLSQRCDSSGCKQLCIERPNSTGAECACEDGNKLDVDEKTCRAEVPVLERKIVYTDANKICFVSINAITSHQHIPPIADCTIVNSTNNITRFTIDTHNSTFYFTDGHKIYYQRAFSINGSQEVYSSSREIIDLTYDWTTGAIYWFEWNATGGVCYKIAGLNSIKEEITKTSTKPITITFDPYTQRLFWMASDIMGSTVRLYTTGSDRKTSNITSPVIVRPTDLEYDWSTNRLVWTDEGFMGRMNANGTNDIKFALNVSRKYNCLTVYKNYTIIGYSVPNRPDESAFTVVQDGENGGLINFQISNMKKVDEVKVYDQQLLAIEPCEKDNGGCEQICLPGIQTVCGCYAGYMLNEDGRTCYTDTMLQDFILAMDSIDYKAYQISMDGKSMRALRMVEGNVPKAIDFDTNNQRIVWIDQLGHRIKYFKLGDTKVKVGNKDDITQYSHVAVDVSTGHFYVTLNNKIAVIDPDFDVKTLITTSQTPGKLKVFPQIGQMVWVEGSKIRKAKMDGTEPNDFVTQGISTPSDIAFDYEDKALYWCDSTLDKIERIELMQSGRQTIVSGTGEQPNNIDVAGQYLYYTSSINTRALYRRDKKDGSHFTQIFNSPLIGGLSSLFVYQKPQRALNEECSVANGRCCKFCLPLNIGRKCACADGSILNSDGRTCSLEMECPLSIPNAELEETCLPCYNRHCSFICNNGFKLTVSGSVLNCGSFGKWNYSSEVCQEDIESGPHSPIIIGAAAGGSSFIVIVIIIAVVCFLRKRSKRVPRKPNILRPPQAPPRVDTFKEKELEEEYDYIDDSKLRYGAVKGQTPPYLELSESQRDYVTLTEKNPYKQKIVGTKRSSEIVHDDYLTASIDGSLKRDIHDLRVSLPEEDQHGYLKSSSDGFRRGSVDSEVSTRYQRWDMFEQQARGHQVPPASDQDRYHDGRRFHYEQSQRY